MENTIDIWWEKANLVAIMFAVLGLMFSHTITYRTYGHPPSIINALQIVFIIFGFMMGILFWLKTVNLFESHPPLEMAYVKTLDILPWIFLSFSLILQFIRLNYYVIPEIGITRVVFLIETSYTVVVFLFGFAFYRIDLYAKMNLKRLVSNKLGGRRSGKRI